MTRTPTISWRLTCGGVGGPSRQPGEGILYVKGRGTLTAIVTAQGRIRPELRPAADRLVQAIRKGDWNTAFQIWAGLSAVLYG